ncbi:uncharacterized protein PHALS_14765 [Plasmopara halstedii]|uniref:Uncharacterized protein n=1 Tax=Plasmopara halstedii TaxID=4781 RepID=A0A0P1AS76_PLAHL|nr:uncharacterized protein PHALS_14765 [Plasmopara halstedii]CEG43985.1 hypothetical protein PHALS_14765 [Plasmopara halstedii]|eukprot:XP_024580354.1 hypothetical protein PHALS_14765 [Plasmopara halstedii]
MTIPSTACDLHPRAFQFFCSRNDGARTYKKVGQGINCECQLSSDDRNTDLSFAMKPRNLKHEFWRT